MGYQPRKSIPRFVDENDKPIPPGVFTSQHDTREVYALFGCGDPATRTMASQSYDPNRSTYVPPHIISGEHGAELMWGVTAREAAAALIAMTNAFPSVTPEPIGDSSDGVKPCGYDAL